MEEITKEITINVSHAVEIISACVIGFALLRLLFYFLKTIFTRRHVSEPSFQGRLEKLRVQFGSSVAVSLELLLGADVLATAVAPSWDDIGKLAAIAVLRTALNYFLEKELRHMHVKM
jgi:uncharacterized membrane protein